MALALDIKKSNEAMPGSTGHKVVRHKNTGKMIQCKPLASLPLLELKLKKQPVFKGKIYNWKIEDNISGHIEKDLPDGTYNWIITKECEFRAANILELPKAELCPGKEQTDQCGHSSILPENLYKTAHVGEKQAEGSVIYGGVLTKGNGKVTGSTWSGHYQPDGESGNPANRATIRGVLGFDKFAHYKAYQQHMNILDVPGLAGSNNIDRSNINHGFHIDNDINSNTAYLSSDLMVIGILIVMLSFFVGCLCCICGTFIGYITSYFMNIKGKYVVNTENGDDERIIVNMEE